MKTLCIRVKLLKYALIIICIANHLCFPYTSCLTPQEQGYHALFTLLFLVVCTCSATYIDKLINENNGKKV